MVNIFTYKYPNGLRNGAINCSDRLELVFHTYHIQKVIEKNFTHEVLRVRPHRIVFFSVFKGFQRNFISEPNYFRKPLKALKITSKSISYILQYLLLGNLIPRQN